MQTFEQDKFIDVAGVRIRYRERPGEAPPIIFLHGITESLEFWTLQLEAGIGDHRLIALDLPGHGLSDDGEQPYDADKFAHFMVAFADALSIGRFYSVGNSLGGGITIRLAGLLPSRVMGIVLADSAFIGKNVFFPFRLMTLPVIGELLTKPGPNAVKQQLSAIVYDQASITPALRKVVERNTYRVGGAKAFLRSLRATATLSGIVESVYRQSHAILKSLDMPVLFIHGKQDVVLPAKDSVAAAALTPRARIVLLDDCGHTPQLEKPSSFNAELTRFVAACCADAS
ncbi:acetoin dehydrogenase [Bradyrhizobium sp. SSBR45G]|uniref:alpha/beta fold hydrolase n=1 Tax=unclassified Bradyrhizobium TaxID=2631580 RepID=UPI002342907A|nr:MULTISPECIES: alpha/beta fold hydrolase [unclassified Bradyrhizobium]GLH80179.1 acetoin dehydrogenase [Bradyrhizobium sp. SSBR45G]GLH87672.1 acetoin dehydrogenase [Bradyrhizobium sp. SSBR45R]